ncbi:hypothetical protein E8E14_014349 [Neopestalotiopsis sp. 37M]|nr:hypothetical protein E8E14_014349 [Neopestalotiopsis sp. 37M]
MWDLASLETILKLNTATHRPVKAIATASWAFAACLGIKDEDLTLEQNLACIRILAPVVARAGLPLSVDLQDGYGSRLGEAITAAILAGAHGANIEDSSPSIGLTQGAESSLYTLDEQVCRLQWAVEAAGQAGCPDFVLNARCDVFASKDPHLDGQAVMREALKRGEAYLAAGATTIFFWRAAGTGFSEQEVRTLVRGLDGRVAIRLGQAKGALSSSALAELGVMRISVGPSLFQIGMKSVQESAMEVLTGGNLAVH